MRRATAVSALLALALLACATIEVSSDWNPAADFSRLHTWAWLAQERPASGDPRLDSALLDARIRSAVESELGARGFAKAEAGAADFLVAYHVALERKLVATTIDDYYGGVGYRHWPRPGYSQTYVHEFEVGSLMLDVLDPRSRELIWRGTAQAEILPAATPEEREARVREGVRRILERFPPQS
jgi:hypothetical protein